mmetsp:Transcript_10324/g.31941  ORF Transcript_10324/g.31941 Transcript_10324/m.31941 type:complete len:405 (-) Transcript_10324:233-1447(-)
MHPADCGCPACRLARWHAHKYRNQFRVESAVAAEEDLVDCPMHQAYGFCPHGITCFLRHAPSGAGPRSVDAIVADIDALDDEHDRGVARCRVCGGTSIQHFGIDRVLPTATCVTCCQTLYCPLVPELAEALFAENATDYQAYKDAVDVTRARLRNAMRVAFSKEAHRVGCSMFAWSLVDDAAVAESLRAALALVPTADRILSVGASSGYVEYLYQRAAAASSSRDGDAAPLAVEAYDEIPNPRFDVKVASGGPEKVLGCDRSRTILLLCWPPFGSQDKDLSTMGFDTLTNFLHAGGTTVVYIGDESSTGDFRFHAVLAQQFKPAPGYRVRHELRRWSPQDMGMVFAGQDTIGVYERRPPPPQPGCAVVPIPPLRPAGAPPPPVYAAVPTDVTGAAAPMPPAPVA